jgi:23S rRNA (guanosine2251-2'-O)-methyltransferase
MSGRGNARGARRPPPEGKRERRDLGQQVEGRQAVRELLTAGRRKVHDLWLSTDAGDAPVVTEIASLAESAGVRVRKVPADQIERRARTGAPQGVVAFAAPVPTADLDALLADPRAFLVALDGVTDPQNLGAVMRSAETAGATGMVLATHRAVGLTPAVAKAAAGALEYLPVTFVSGIPGALDRARRVPACGVPASMPTVTSRCTTSRSPTRRSCSYSEPKGAACRGWRALAATSWRRSRCTAASRR